ncbi:MAG: alpha/beta fold hydrolase [Actinomycetota bacterium]
MAELTVDDATLHIEVDGEGDPVTLLAHGLTNSCLELADLTTLVPGTKVRFCFRGHGHSSSPEAGYRFADFARDVDAVATAYDARIAFGTSLGAGAIGHLVVRRPDRFDKLILLLPAGVDRTFRYKDRLLRTAALIEGKSQEDAIETILSDPERVAKYLETPWLRDFDRRLLAGLNPVGVPRAIREVIEDYPIHDREALRAIGAPTLIIGREGDDIHPAEVARILAEMMPNAELVMFDDAESMYRGIPHIVERVRDFVLA